MNRKFILFFLFLVFVLARHVFAYQGDMGFHYMIPKNAKIPSDLYLLGWNVEVDAEVDGDLFVLGGVAHVRGPVHGNVYLAGGRVEIDGPVSGDVNILAISAETHSICRATRMLALLAEEIGESSADLLAFGWLVDSEGIVGEDTLLGGVQVDVGGNHQNHLLCVGGHVEISGKIQGDAEIKANNIVVLPDAMLMGNIAYTSPNVMKGVTADNVKGMITHNYPPPHLLGVLHFPWIYTLVHKGLSAIWLTVAGLFAVTTWLNRPSRSIIDAMLEYPWESFGTGLLICLAVPGVGIILIVSVLGLPIGFILLGLFAIGIYITRLFASLYIGERFLGILEHHRPPYWQSLPIGVVIFTVLTSIPFIGVIFSLIPIPLVFGAKFMAGRKLYEETAHLP